MSDAVKGVLFDLDNTLIDWSKAGDWDYSERKHLGYIHQYLVDQGRPLSSTVEVLAMSFREQARQAWENARVTLRAPHIVTVMQDVLVQFGFEPDDKVTMRDVMEAYDWGEEDGVTVFPDVPQALQQLIDDDIKIGIVTNAWQPMWLRDAELKYHDLLRYFPNRKIRLSAADVGYLKPHPKIFEKALSLLGTQASETLFVGDNPTADIAGAQKVGMRAILRVNHDKPPAISDLITPDAIIRNFDELLPLVYDWDATTTKS